MKIGVSFTLRIKEKRLRNIFYMGIFLVLSLTTSLAQSDPNYQFTLSNVNFVDCIEYIKKDSITDFGAPYNFNHWTETESKPIAYSSEAGNIKVKARILFTCSAENPDSIWIRGVTSSDSVMFAEKLIAPQGPLGGSYLLNYTPTAHNEDLILHEVKFIESFSIKWQYALPPQGAAQKNWFDIENGISTNTVYVTHKNPKIGVDSIGYDWYHGLFKTSCIAANGLSNDSLIVEKIWEEFEGLEIKSGDEGLKLQYYNDWLTSRTVSSWLLYTKDGQCGSHLRLFLDMLKIHGIEESSDVNNLIFVRSEKEDEGNATIGKPDAFLIKKWEIPDGPGQYGGPLSESMYGYPNYTRLAFIPHKLDTIPSNPTYNTWIIDRDTWLANSTFNWWLNDIMIDVEGVQGQSSNNPLSYFTNHQIAFHDDKYLDVSYGKTYDGDINMTWESDMEDKSIFAYCKRVTIIKSEAEINTILNLGFDIDIEGDGIMSTEVKEYQLIVFTKDLTLFKLKQSISESLHH